MSALNHFRFDGFHLRPTNPLDRALAEQWTAMDPAHAGVIAPEFWLEQRLGRDSFLLSDKTGPVFFFKMHILAHYRLRWLEEHDGVQMPVEQNLRNCVQIFLQFAPYDTDYDDALRFQLRRRMRAGLVKGQVWLEKVLRQYQATEVFLDTRSEPLVHFSVNRLGFTQDGIGLRRRL